MQHNRYYYRIFLIISDFILLGLSCKLAYYIRFGHHHYEQFYASFFIIFSLAWVGAGLFHRVYELEHIFNLKKITSRLLLTLFTQLLFICLFIVSFKAYYFSRIFLLSAYTASMGSILIFRLIMGLLYSYYQNLSYSKRKIVLVGTGETAGSLFDFFSTQDATVFRFLGNFDAQDDKNYVVKQLDELKQFCLREKVNELYFTLPNSPGHLIDEIAHFADQHFIHFRIITHFDLLERKDVEVEFYGRVPIIRLRKEPLSYFGNRLLKRTFDMVFSLLVILTVFPILFPIIALLIKLDSRGPVFFKQKRSGWRNNQFACYKFRTMVINNEADTRQATKNDKRVTRVGRFLRKTNLDELPQFFNVLMGQMSVVGPRPHPLKLTEEYAQRIEKYLVRHFINPGVTGYAQVNGYRGATIDPSLMQKRVDYDTWYLQNWSLWLDIKIIFLTVWNMAKGEENAY